MPATLTAGDMEVVAILGCGYTGRRVAAQLRERKVQVVATSRTPEALDLQDVGKIRLDLTETPPYLNFIPEGARIVYSIPPLGPDTTLAAVEALQRRSPVRVVYLSTTGVYGGQSKVDERTSPAPDRPEMRMRLDAEQAIASGPWSSLILRPAAIYGPGRGVHVRVREGTYRLGGKGDNYVSRIHVEDLAALVVAGLFSDVEGAWPVADDEPSTSLEMARYCAKLLGKPTPEGVPVDTLHPTRRADRRVNGRAIREKLGIALKFPSYLSGVSASIQAENAPG